MSTTSTVPENSYIQYEILECKVITQAGNTLEITSPIIANLELFESITLPGITGKMTILDSQGFKEFGNVTAGDTFIFSYKTFGSQIFNNTFTISDTKFDEFLQDDVLMNTSSFSFMSPWYLSGIIQTYSNLWKNQSLDKIASAILKYCNATIGTIEPSKVTLEHFGSVYWTPIHTIIYLMDFYGEGMTLFTDIQSGKVNLMSIKSLFEGKNGEVDNAISMFVLNTNYEGYVYHETLEQSSDLVKYVGNGLGQTILNGYNYDQKQFQQPTPSVTASQIDFKHYATKGTIQTDYISTQYAYQKQVSVFPQGQNPVSTSQLNTILSNQVKSRYIKLFADAVKLNVFSNGSTDRKAGQIIEVSVPSLTKMKSVPNKSLSGKYLIKEIKRIFTGNNTKDIISLVNTGYMQNDNPKLISW